MMNNWKESQSKIRCLWWGNHCKWFPLVGAAQSRVSDAPLPAEVRGDACLAYAPQALAYLRNASIR